MCQIKGTNNRSLIIKIIVLQSNIVIMENSDILLDICQLAHVYYDCYDMDMYVVSINHAVLCSLSKAAF